MRPLPVYCNPTSGGGERAEEEAGAALEEAGHAFELRRVEPEGLAAELRSAAQVGEAAVGVCGGDGSVSAAADALAGTETALAVFPGGTLNHFALALDVDSHAAAAEAVAAARYRQVDVGEVNGRIFVNGVSIGLYPRSLRIRRELEARLGKWPAALIAAIAVLSDVHDRVVRLEGPELDGNCLAPLVWVGPGKGSFASPTREPRELHSQTLELVVVTIASGWRLLRFALSAVNRGGDALAACLGTPDCAARHLAGFTLHARSREYIDLGIDGELARMELPLRFRARPGALRVARGVPRDAGDEG